MCEIETDRRLLAGGDGKGVFQLARVSGTTCGKGGPDADEREASFRVPRPSNESSEGSGPSIGYLPRLPTAGADSNG